MGIIKDILTRQNRMEDAREPYEGLMNWNIRVAVPAREKISDYEIDDKGNIKGKGIWDPTAAASLETWKNGILGWHTPSNLPSGWFREAANDRELRENRRIRKFLQEVDEQLNFALDRSNYYEMKGVRLTDSGGIGPSYMFADEDVETGKINFRVPHPRQLWHELDFFGVVNKMHYRYELPLREAIRTFGRDWLTYTQDQTEKTQPDQKIRIIQAIYKNYEFDADKESVGMNRPWLSYTVNLDGTEVEGGTLMQQSGYNTVNPIPWLLNRATHELYPRGVVGQFLIEIITSNYMMRDMLMASQRAVRPAMIALDTLKHKLKPQAGGYTWVDRHDFQAVGNAPIAKQLFDRVDYPFAFEVVDRFQSVIESRFGVPFFLLMNRLETPTKTATEILQKQGERAVLMAPFLGILNAVTDMELDRITDIEFTGGRMPEIPEEFLLARNKRIDIQYTGPLPQLIKQYYEVNRIQAAVSQVAFMMEVDEKAIFNIDTDVMTQELLKASDAPADGIVPLENVKEIRLALAQAEAEQQMVNQAEQLDKILPQLDKAPEKGSAVEQLQTA